jgi:excisionase family DNA binding protein
MEKLMVSPEEAAEALGISRSRVYVLIGNGELPSAKFGRVRRIAVRDLEALAARVVEAEQCPLA